MARSIVTAMSFLLIVTGVCGSPSNAALRRFEFSQTHMGTTVRILFFAADDTKARRASTAAFSRIRLLEDAMSDYKETSELMLLCRRAGQGWVRVSTDLFAVLAASEQFAVMTGGAFDVTCGPIVRLWRRARRTGEMPEKQLLANARSLVGYRKLRLDRRDRRVRLLAPGMLLDLGGLAKGYAADQAVRVLRKYGIKSMLVAVGGDIVAGAPPPDQLGWRIAVTSIDQPAERAEPRLLLADAAVSTSGDREQYVEIQGTRYSHIVDPRTGVGVRGQKSVTVVAPDGLTADALATAANVLDPDSALRLIDSIAGAAAIISESAEKGTVGHESRAWRVLLHEGVPAR